MPRYIRPAYSPPPEDMAAAFEALDTGFSRAIINYFSQNPEARPPDAARAFNKSRADVYRQVYALETVGILVQVTDSGRKIGSGWSFAYEINPARVNAVLDDLRGYLLAEHEHNIGSTSPETTSPPVSESGA